MTESQKDKVRERSRRYRLRLKSKPMTEEQKEARRAKARERHRRYIGTEKGKAKNKECQAQWREMNREKCREKAKDYRALLKQDPTAYEHYKSLQRKWERTRRIRGGDEYRADMYARLVDWRERNRDRYLANNREYQRKYRLEHGSGYAKVKERMERDAVAYARFRLKAREKTRRKAEAEGRDYVPRIYRRIPDCMRKGELERLVPMTQAEWFKHDAEAYAAYRERNRNVKRRRAEAAGREYKPRLSRRIPDWCRKGECERIARRSVFLRENHDAEELMAFDGFGLDLAVERKKRREA